MTFSGSRVSGLLTNYPRSLRFRFMSFNNRVLRRILIRDSRTESSIVALYKKLELQNAMEILDSVSGDISAAPSIVSLWYETFVTPVSLSHHLLIVRSDPRLRGNPLCFSSHPSFICFSVRKRKCLLNRRRSSWLLT